MRLLCLSIFTAAFVASSSAAHAGPILFDHPTPTAVGVDLNSDLLFELAAFINLEVDGQFDWAQLVQERRDLSNVGFQYGVGSGEPKLPAGMIAPQSIPEPAMLLLLAPGIGLAVRQRARARRGTDSASRA